MHDEKDEKYNGFCLRCVDYPPYFRDFSDKPISRELLYNPWCTLCYQKDDADKPTAFWEKGISGRFSYKCDLKVAEKIIGPIKIQKICDWSSPADIEKSQDFDKELREHLHTAHGMNLQAAMIETTPIMCKQVINKYLVPNPKR